MLFFLLQYIYIHLRLLILLRKLLQLLFQEYHHIKKENIGLIEVMGLAVLPSRLKKEMESLAECLVNKKDIAS